MMLEITITGFAIYGCARLMLDLIDAFWPVR